MNTPSVTMSLILSSSSTIEKLFIHGTLTKLYEHVDVPSYLGIERLQSELVSNTLSIIFTLCDRLTSHSLLVINDVDCTTTTAGAVKPTPSLKSTPLVTLTVHTITTRSDSDLNTFNTYDLYRIEYQTYQQQLDTYLLYYNTSKCLVNRLLPPYRYYT